VRADGVRAVRAAAGGVRRRAAACGGNRSLIMIAAAGTQNGEDAEKLID